MAKFLVLGGSGFVGGAVARLLSYSGEQFVAPRRERLNLFQPDSISSYLAEHRPDIIINCASHGGSLHYVSERAADVIHDNTMMTLNLYRALRDEAAKPVVVNPISNCSYPGEAEVQVEADWWSGPVHDSVWSFGNAKRAWVTIAECYARQYGVESRNVVFPNAYGPGDSTDPNRTHALNGMIIRMLAARREGRPRFSIWGTGAPVREWIYVDDFARALVLAGGNSTPRLLNIAQGRGYSIKETASMIAKAIEFSGVVEFDPSFPDGAPVKVLDDTLFRKAWGLFDFTPIAVGIERTVRYYEEAL